MQRSPTIAPQQFALYLIDHLVGGGKQGDRRKLLVEIGHAM
jgi:hypothetical protein